MSSKDKAGPQEPAQNTGGDEAFISFAFVIVTVVMVVMYSATAIRVGKVFALALWSLAGMDKSADGKKRYRGEEDEDSVTQVLQDLKNYVMYIPTIFITFAANPALATHGLTILLAQKPILWNVAMPKFLKAVLRVKLLIVVLWVVLFSMALYTNLSFDAYKALDLAPDATEKQIKKRYRDYTKLYHPDHNPGNATALQIYTKMRKGYKALVNKEEFEKEAQQEDLSVGVALPSWLTNRENDFLIKIIVLGSLFGFPYWLFRKFSGNEGDKISDLCKKILEAECRLIPLYNSFGIPEEKKMVQRNNQIALYLQAFTANGVQAGSMNMDYMPPCEEFLKRGQNTTQQGAMQFFMSLGIQEEATLKGVMASLVEGLTRIKNEEDQTVFSTTITPVSDAEFKAAYYIFNLVVEECDLLIDELNVIINGSIKQCFVLKNHHKKVLETLVWSHEKKVANRDSDVLIEAARNGKQEALGILPAIHATMQKYENAQKKDYEKKMGGCCGK